MLLYGEVGLASLTVIFQFVLASVIFAHCRGPCVACVPVIVGLNQGSWPPVNMLTERITVVAQAGLVRCHTRDTTQSGLSGYAVDAGT
jgi:hypothetical protein